jgi:signal transduction histidine kinase
VWFLVLSLLPLFLSNTIGYQVTRRIIERQAQRYLIALATAEAGHVAAEIERHQQNLDAEVEGNTALAGMLVLLADSERRAADAADLDRLRVHLERKLEELPAFSELIALNADGVAVAATAAQRTGSDWSATDVFQAGRLGRYFTEDVESHGGLLTPVFRLATPVRASAGTAVGVVVATVGFDRIPMFFRMADHVVGDVHSYLLDDTGNLLQASHVHPLVEHGRPMRSPATDGVVDVVQRYANYEGVRVLAAAAPLAAGSRDWWYVAEAPERTILGQLRGLGLLAGVLEAGFALLLVAIVWLVARSIVTPLRRLVGAAERIRAGELGVAVRVDRADELGDLGRTFNQMSQELRTSTEQIQELHDQEMRRAAQLASVGELASGIAHEIKNPLIGVSSGLDLLGKRGAVDGQTTTLVEQMREQVQRIEVAIRDLLSYARPKEPRVIATDLNRLADRVVRLVAPQAERAGVRVETRLSTVVSKVPVDPELMTQTLVNLALNGIQAMEPGGILTLATSRNGDDVQLDISDTGSGIPQDKIEKIFRPFFTTKHRGTGLGLAISRGIVERHGGRLDVRSTPGEGTTFTLTFTPADAGEALP